MSTPTKTYMENGWKPPQETMLDEETYRKILPRWVKACVDAILYFYDDHNKMFKMVITKRKIQPMMDWWIFGGRIFVTDESLQHALSRKLREEIGLTDVSPSRFSKEPLRLQMYKWAPDNSVVLAPAFSLEITPDEYKQMQQKLSQSPEYSELMATDPVIVARNLKFHEALRDYASSLCKFLGI